MKAQKLSLLISLIFFSCGKERPAAMNESQKRDLIPIGMIQDLSQFKLKTLTQKIPGRIYSHGRGEAVLVESDSVPPLYQMAFSQLFIEALPETTQDIKMRLHPQQKLVAYHKLQGEDLLRLQKQDPFGAQDLAQRDFLVEIFHYPITYIKLKVGKNKDGESTRDFEEIITDYQHAEFIRVNFNDLSKRVTALENHREELLGLEEKNTLEVENFKDREYLFRRTLIDSPNLFTATFPGTAGPLSIVKFHFKNDRVEIRRADALLPRQDTSEVDEELIISLPAQYLKKITVDQYGLPLSKINLVKSTPNEKGAIAVIDWTKNSLPNLLSPLNYYQLEDCLVGQMTKEVGNTVKEQKGLGLHLTMTSTYPTRPLINCLNFNTEANDMQFNYTFSERFSFKLYREKDQILDEKPLLDIPYEAQKRLGFGLFTDKKTTPTHEGRTGIKGTEESLANIYDLRDKKSSILYVLAGIPSAKENQVLREKLILATKEVVADFNRGFAKAFEDTSMQRTKEVIQLQVEELSESEVKKYGLESATKMEMGDLGRNYIYYIAKTLEFGIIGLGGSHSNPRSGKVENASVFMYGGNIMKSVHNLKLRQKNRNELKKIKEEAPLLSDIVLAAPTSAPAVKNDEESEESSRQALSSLMQWKIDPGQRDFSGGQESTVNTGEFMAKFQLAQSAGTEENLAALAAIYNGTVENGKIIKEPYSQYYSQLHKKIHRAGHCLHEGEHFNLSAEGMSEIDLLIAIYKPTLVHELGHNFGLRHNFIASYDKSNFFFDEKDQQESKKKTFPRDYSSVMDYSQTDHLTYDGLGPYDVQALRLAYAQTFPVNHEKIKTLSDLKLLLKEEGKDWYDLTSNKVKDLGLKKFLFCSDEDTRNNLRCNRHDQGTSAFEIVDNIIKDYEEGYTLRNFRNNRLRFSKSTGNYIPYLHQTFSQIRRFLEEYFFYYLTGREDTLEAKDLLRAVKRGQTFFEGLIRTPDMPLSLFKKGVSRFSKIPVKDENKSVVDHLLVEKKIFYDESFDSENMQQINIRGIYWDKIMALINLTNSKPTINWNLPDQDFQFSYFHLETLLEGKTHLKNSSLLKLLNNVIFNTLTPAVVDRDYFVSIEKNDLKSSTNSLLREFARRGIMHGLADPTTPHTQEDAGSAFQVFSRALPPSGTPYITRPGSSQGIKYWAPKEAVFIRPLIENIYPLQNLRAQAEQWREKFLRRNHLTIMLEQMDPTHSLEIESLLEEKEKLDTALEIELLTLPENFFPKQKEEKSRLRTLDSFLFSLIKLMNGQKGNLQNLKGEEQEKSLFEIKKILFKNWISTAPFLAISLSAIPQATAEENLKNPFLLKVVPQLKELQDPAATIFTQLKELSEYYYQQNPYSPF